jgi:L-threonylcarbamoyladenylate synthase
MAEHSLLTVTQAVVHLRAGAIIAYPTEAVFGLGCDPGNEKAVRRLLALKKRPAAAGLIRIAVSYERFSPLVPPIGKEIQQKAMSTWPGPVTWLFPRAAGVPDWLAGDHDTIALRVTAHSVCRELCAACGGAIVSTSANPSSSEPARTAGRVEEYFGTHLGGIVAGTLGGDDRPSEIRDLASGAVIRKS